MIHENSRPFREEGTAAIDTFRIPAPTNAVAGSGGILDRALELLRAGISVVPVRAGTSKAPAFPWKEYQQRLPTEQEVRNWFTKPGYGLGVVTGAVSGNLEMTEIEGRALNDLGAVRDLAEATGLLDMWDHATTGWREVSPSGGIHWFYRLDGTVAGNQKLASRPGNPDELADAPMDKTKVLAETRGEGGFVVVAPTPGEFHAAGRPWVRVPGGELRTLNPEQRSALHALLATMGSEPEPPAGERGTQPSVFGRSQAGGGFAGTTPGDHFEAQTSWHDILTPAGWTALHTQGRTTYWRRPGKTDTGFSASTGRAEDRDRLWVFSTSTDFPDNEPITKFHAYAILHHGGNHTAAAAELRRKGFGSGGSQDQAHRPAARRPEPARVSLDQAHAVFQHWLGQEYDTDALDVVLAAAACNRLDGDPLWLLLLSGSGNAKTETVQAMDGDGAMVTSTIASVGALLSATSSKEKTKEATGGLLRRLGASGVLVIKDVTSILSMDRNSRAEVLAALREVYDGRWSRNVGTDGGRTLDWEGRLIVIGAVTTAWDRAHDVIASMGDRFVIVRMDSTQGRQAAGRQAIQNTGHETEMRQALAEAAGGVLANIDTSTAPAQLTQPETELLLSAANIVTLARTGVDFDYRGDVIDAHAPEMPTRFAKQLAQVVRGSIALGKSREDAMRLAIRCARDSMPPLRLAILDDVAAHPDTPLKDVRRRLGKPRATVDRQLQALNMLEVLTVEEEPTMHRGVEATQWRYSVNPEIDPTAINPNSVPDLLVPPHKDTEEGQQK